MPRLIGIKFVLFIFLFAFNASALEVLKIGDPAPALKIDKWYNGEGITEFKRGKIYVVEFFGSWCPPCRDEIPHMNKIAKQYGDDVQVVAIAGREKGHTAEERQANLEAFLKEHKIKQEYLLGFDSSETMKENWLISGNGHQGIPFVFVVDRDGTIAYMNYVPYLDHESVGNPLKQIVDGRWKTSAEGKEYTKEARQKEHDLRFQIPVNRGDFETALAVAREYGETEPFFKRMAADILIDNVNRAEEAIPLLKELVQTHWDDADSLSSIIYLLVHEKLRATRHYDQGLARRAAEQVIKMLFHPENEEQKHFANSRWFYFERVAQFYFATGAFDRASYFMNEAIKGMPEESKKHHLKNFAELYAKYDKAASEKKAVAYEAAFDASIQSLAPHAQTQNDWIAMLALAEQAALVARESKVFGYQKLAASVMIEHLSYFEKAAKLLKEVVVKNWDNVDELTMIIQYMVQPQLMETTFYDEKLTHNTANRILELLEKTEIGNRGSFYYPPLAGYYASQGQHDLAAKYQRMAIEALPVGGSRSHWTPILKPWLDLYETEAAKMSCAAMLGDAVKTQSQGGK